MENSQVDISCQCEGFDKSLLTDIKRAVDATIKLIGGNSFYSLSILVCEDENIRELNKTYRGVDRATDVLSFPAGMTLPDSHELFLGDIAISYQAIVRQASKYQHSVHHEISLLTVHGVLHLLGYDHLEIEEEKEMWRLQKNILNDLGYDIDLLPGDSYAQE